MMETEIGNRGSKSIIVCPNKQFIHKLLIIVKEQRVDGSWWEKSWFSNIRPSIISQYFSYLRCTLMGLEINYLARDTRALSKILLYIYDFSHVYLCALKYF